MGGAGARFGGELVAIADSTVLGATGYRWCSIEIDTNGTARLYFNGVLAMPVVGAPAGSSPMSPFVNCTFEDATSRTLTEDKFAIWQSR